MIPQGLQANRTSRGLTARRDAESKRTRPRVSPSSTMTPPPKKQTPEQQHAEEQPAPIKHLLACDDLLGEIYSSCEDSATKHALRVSCSACYRSPAINSFIDTFNVKPIIQHLLGPTPEASAARGRLQSVDTIQFIGCDLDTLDATAIPLLFPVIRSNHGRIDLSGGCLVSSGFLGILAAQTHITELQINTPSALHELASFGSLQSLVLIGNGTDSLSLEPLCAGIPSACPQLQLTKLELIYSKDVTGLDVCLARKPLQELHLINVSFPHSLAPAMRLASPTLRVMCVRPNLSFPDILNANFPSLHHFEIESIDLGQIPGMSAEESVQRCNRLASGIAGLPCVQDKEGVAWLDTFAITGNRWPANQFLELLQGLAPLRPALQSIKGAGICNANVGHGAMRVIASLVPNSESLAFWLEGGHSYTDVEEGLVVAVSTMPNLKHLRLDVAESWLPCDVFVALMRARQGCFQLKLVTDSVEYEKELNYVRRNWEKVRELSPDQFTATLSVS